MRLLGMAVVVGLVCGLGCRSSKSTSAVPPIAKARGTVLVRGAPVEGIMVQFHPQFDMGGIMFIPEGKTAADGTFTVVSGHGGVPVGEYVVTFTYSLPWDPQEGGTPVDRWKGRYAEPVNSRHRVTISAGDNQLEPFRLD